MSAPHIPNLNTLRRGGPRSRGRGQGRSTASIDENVPAQSSLVKDEIIQKTDTDAATSRLSAVEAGYLDDPFAKLLTPGQHPRRLPLMNRGTFARTTAIDRIVDTFLEASGSGKKQIISLGAGSDTRYFRVKQRHPDIDFIYHELDFATNTRAKIALIRSPAFAEIGRRIAKVDLASPEVLVTEDGARLSSESYNIHAQDLRKLPKSVVPLPNVNETRPTLIISECCLIYLSPTDADEILRYFEHFFSRNVPLALAIYEPIRPNDAFGKTMVSNLTARGIQLQTLEKYASLAAQKERLTKYGFGDGAEAADIDFIWRKWIGGTDRERVESLEWMDEVEEFTLFARHYCVAWGWRGFPQQHQWKALPTQADNQ